MHERNRISETEPSLIFICIKNISRRVVSNRQKQPNAALLAFQWAT